MALPQPLVPGKVSFSRLDTSAPPFYLHRPDSCFVWFTDFQYTYLDYLHE